MISEELPAPSEELRKKLLAQEFAMRKKQPEHWAKTKYRKYATMLSQKMNKEKPQKSEKKQSKPIKHSKNQKKKK